MADTFRKTARILAAASVMAAGMAAGTMAGDFDALVFRDATGFVETVDTAGGIDLQNPFFQDLGTNGRSCVTCHQPQTGWTITPANVQARFVMSRGTDPVFRSNDGSNCEGTSSRAPAAYSLLLTRGLIRIGIDVPTQPPAEFAIDRVDDPYNCGAPLTQASMYRRPLPSTNLRFLSAVMWDGRESSATTTILQDLAQQANDATLGHAQAANPLSAQERQQIVAFETGLFTAQMRDDRAGSLQRQGAAGGARALSVQPFFIGVNDPVGLNPTGAPFTSSAFHLFDAWKASREDDPLTRAREAVARGQEIFNTKTFTISGVAGLNGQTFPSGVTVPASMTGTCTICHDAPNVGNHSVKAPLDIGIADPARAPYLPVYTLRNLATGDTVKTTDPGRAMITGKWADIGKFKGPVLRGLAARAPYFHNGSAATLDEVIQFYETRFGLSLTAQERSDLIAFLRAL